MKPKTPENKAPPKNPSKVFLGLPKAKAYSYQSSYLQTKLQCPLNSLQLKAWLEIDSN